MAPTSLGLVLTGMASDGLRGSEHIGEQGGLMLGDRTPHPKTVRRGPQRISTDVPQQVFSTSGDEYFCCLQQKTALRERWR